ncbi:Protein kinase domain [Popillia japonica]|uniref:non-specific serine/threonine protein kinase n=1 Tax=Popillia japonica TaxID=7064 RepID=A0AAW1LD89_POPJA
MSTYTYIKELDTGTFGTVYLCEKKHNRMKVAIKEMMLNKIQLAVAQNEVNVLRSLNHPNICQYYDSFRKNDKFSIVMEYARYGNLYDHLKKRRYRAEYLSRNSAFNIICQILMGLNHLHSRKIIHRDLKSENIFMAGPTKNFVKIGDFGISKILKSDHQKANTVVGTTNYLAPEMCDGKAYDIKSDVWMCDGKAYDIKSDVWSFGCIVYEVCALERLFEGTIAEVVMGMKSGTRKCINTQCFGEEIQEIIESTTQIDPVLRPTTTSLMALPVLARQICIISVKLGNIWNNSHCSSNHHKHIGRGPSPIL